MSGKSEHRRRPPAAGPKLGAMLFGRRFLASLFIVMLLLAQGASARVMPPVAVQGRLELATVPAQPIPLEGEWGFAWHRFVAPDWQQLPTQAFVPVPGNWNGVTADGKAPGGE